jgi:hypothetical protein
MTEGKPHKVGYRMRRVGVNDPVLVSGSIGRAESKSLLLALSGHRFQHRERLLEV